MKYNSICRITAKKLNRPLSGSLIAFATGISIAYSTMCLAAFNKVSDPANSIYNPINVLAGPDGIGNAHIGIAFSMAIAAVGAAVIGETVSSLALNTFKISSKKGKNIPPKIQLAFYAATVALGIYANDKIKVDQNSPERLTAMRMLTQKPN
jgi:hypothetical protein